MRLYYREQMAVILSITWFYELVDDANKKGTGDSFYVRLTPHINRSGKAGANAVKRVREGNFDKIVPAKQLSMEQKMADAEKALVRAIKGIKKPLVKEMRKKLNKG